MVCVCLCCRWRREQDVCQESISNSRDSHLSHQFDFFFLMSTTIIAICLLLEHLTKHLSLSRLGLTSEVWFHFQVSIYETWIFIDKGKCLFQGISTECKARKVVAVGFTGRTVWRAAYNLKYVEKRWFLYRVGKLDFVFSAMTLLHHVLSVSAADSVDQNIVETNILGFIIVWV